MACIEDGKYDEMYRMLDAQTRSGISEEAFAERNKKIYEGIEAADVRITVTQAQKAEARQRRFFMIRQWIVWPEKFPFPTRLFF